MTRIILAGALALLLALPSMSRAQGYKIVVRADNPVTEVTRAYLSGVFLKRETRWPGGVAAVPVDLDKRSPVRAAFSEAVHGRPVGAVEAHWQQQIFSGREVPPVAKRNAQDILAFIRNSRGAVGYVADDVDPGPGVKVLTVRDG